MRRRPLARSQKNVRTRHDEWVKRALSLWLGALGDVQIDARIAGESRRGDVLYTEGRDDPARRRTLGMLGELARGVVLFEPFRKPISLDELITCVLKAIELRAQQTRLARRTGKKRKNSKTPPADARVALCAITPSMSDDLIAQAGATLIHAETPGLYQLSPMWQAALVVVNRLPQDASTMWLRLLGRDRVQAQAVSELLGSKKPDTLCDATVALLIAWQQSLPPTLQQSEDEQEMAMNFERVYERWERKVKAEGKAEGRREGKAEGEVKGKAAAVVLVLESRGLELTGTQRQQVLGCTDVAQLDRWLLAASTAPSVAALLSGGASRRPRAR